MSESTEPFDAQQIIRHFHRDRYAALSKIEIEHVEPGRARVRMDAGEAHLNSLDMLHGGAIFTLGDLAFAAASNAGGRAAVAVHVDIDFHRPGRAGVYYAEATETHTTNRLAHYAVKITDESGTLIASFHGIAYRLSMSLKEAIMGGNSPSETRDPSETSMHK